MNFQFEDIDKIIGKINKLLNNLEKKEIQIQQFFSNYNFISKSKIIYIFKLIKIFSIIPLINKRIIFRYINYLNKKAIDQSSNNYSKKKVSKGENTLKIFLLIHMIIFIIKIDFKRKNYDEESDKNIQFFNKKIFYFLELISTFISKLYLDKAIDINSLEMTFKIFILFTINDNLEIKEKNDIENIVYLKECLKIINIIYKNKSSEKEQNLLINIFEYMNNNICYKDKDNKFMNYTNKIYLLNNDNNITKLISLMKLIYEINNSNLTKQYFEFLSNIYFFQFNYNNLNWPLYQLIEPLLVNIDKKEYMIIEKEISFPLFLITFIRHLFKKERIYINEHSCILKNGFYFGENNKIQSGIIAEMDNLQDNCILTFGFKLIIKDRKDEEHIIFQFKSINNIKTQLKISILNINNINYLTIIDNKNNEENICKIIEEKYYIFSIQIKGTSFYVNFCYDNSEKHEHIEIPKMSFKLVKVYLCVGCDIEKKEKNSKDKSIHNNFNYINKFTGFIGDIHIINTKSFRDKKDDRYFLQRNFLNLCGRYGHTIVKSIIGQQNLDEYIYSNLEELTSKNKMISKEEKEDIFKIYIQKGNNKLYKIIDNIALFISSLNFKLIDYLDDVDYKNYDNKYYEKKKYLKEKKKEFQYYNNFRIKSNNLKPMILEINTKLFNCKFNAFENKSGIIKFIEEDGIFFLLLILEYYYQVIFRISKEYLGKTKNNVDDKYNEKSYINEKIINDDKMNNLNEEENAEINDIYSFNALSKEQNKILEYISNGVKNILLFFLKERINLNFYVKYYKSALFFYQINIVLKQYLLIKDLDSKIYQILLNYLETYHEFINFCFNEYKNNSPDKIYIRIRNFFFEFLLNPELYRGRNENILNKLNNLFDLLNKIINDNHYNEELLSNKIFKKIIKFIFIFYTKNKDLYKKVTKNYISFLSNYINKFYFNSIEGKSIFNIMYEMIEDYKSKTEYSFLSLCLSFALFKSDITFYSDESSIEKIKSNLSKNYLEINNISFIMILYGYYLYNPKNINKFRFMLFDLFQNEKRILIYLLNIFKIFVKDDIENQDILYDPTKDKKIQIGLNFGKLSKFQKKYFENFFELISLFFLDESDYFQDDNKVILIYNSMKNILLELLKEKHIKLFKIIFSSENYFCTKLFFKLLSDYKNVTIIENDIIKFTEELITFHNNPFIFELINKINYIIISEEYEEEEGKYNNQINKEIKKNRINFVITILDSIYMSLK